ncbi:GumC family protein [Jiella pacifica]|uniref:Succinoglycan biosynthesis protein exop n=1 Tax=Jiella pacifica TaxID=2696469 RepID=A0A6N9TAD4_9HYPH|nr:GumC family protein [Jiella pacifica]NDW07016.1 succinoglycan biosynthesis protein exop [Jiella pacifica]
MFDPFEIFAQVWSLRWLVILLTLLGLVVGVLMALATPHKYTAVTEILIDPRDIKVVQNEVTPNGLPSDATLALIESQISVVYSNDVMQRVIDKADLAEDSEFNGKAESFFPSLSLFSSPDDPETERRRELMTLAGLRDALHVSRDPKSFVINLAVTTRNPEKSAKLANLVADSFIEQLGKVQSDTARRASDALSSRLAELRQRVVEAERAAEAYKSENRLVGVGGRLVDDDYIVRINDQLAKARGEMTALRVRADQMRNASVDDVVKGTLPEELTSDSLSRLRSTYSDLAQQNATLAATLGPRHPRRIASEDALRSIRDAIRQELERIVSGAQTELARAEQTDRELSAQVNDLKDKQLETSSSFVRLRELEREVDASRAVYEAFLLRARETGEQESLNTANVRVISSANPPLDPSSTSRKITVVAATMGGFVLGLGLAGLIACVRVLRRALRFSRNNARTTADRGSWLIAGPAPDRSEPITDRADADFTAEKKPSEEPSLASQVRPTVHVPPERVRRSARPDVVRAESGMAERVSRAEAALAETLPVPAHAPRAPVLEPAKASGPEQIMPAEATEAQVEIASPLARSVRSKPEREALRERLRTIAEQARLEASSGDREQTIYNQDIARLQQDILAVKRNLADARSRRHPQGTPPAE